MNQETFHYWKKSDLTMNQNLKNYLTVKKTFNIVFIIVTISVFFQTLLEIYYGRIPFWYDPARDMLLGLQNLKNPTLIGQPTGIPGVFYGPYWIWLISILELINKDPRFISIFLLLIPYFSIFLFFILKIGKIVSRESSIIIWLLFILSFANYFSFIWNPHLMPLFLLIYIYLVLNVDMTKKRLKNILICFFAGVSLGISANFSMSIGIGLIFSSVVFLIIQYLYFSFKKIKNNKVNYFLNSVVILIGILTTFLPFFLFELRHGFNQINSYIEASTNKITGLTGLSDLQILITFLNLPSKIFIVPSVVIFGIILLLFLILILKKSKFNKFSENEIRLSILIFVIIFSVLSIYILSKNPVWDYHFIGFEVLILLLFGIIINRHFYLKYLSLACVIVLFIFQVVNYSYANTIVYDDSLKSKEIEINAVIKDAEGDNFTMFAYSPSIYTFEYDYLLLNKSLANLNDNNKVNPENVYFIFNKKHLFDKDGFIESKTSSEIYATTKTFKTTNGTVIIKRELIRE